MVGVPIGNLQDITLRALDTLRAVDIIACEDTRHSSILLNHYDIKKQLVSCHGHNEAQAAQRIIEKLNAGCNAAYISDAGTPGISDPGGKLVELAIQAGHQAVPIPGPSALSSLLSVLGLPGKRSAFEGFLSPRPGRRRKQLSALVESCDIGIVYESPFRIIALLSDIHALFPEARVVCGRELTKLHEEIIRGTAQEIVASLSNRPSVKGEFVVAIVRSSGAELAED